MNVDKDELIDVIIKGFGVAFLFLAIIAIPKVFEGLVTLGAILFYTPEGEVSNNTKCVLLATRPSMIVQSVGAVIKFVIFIIASINFLRSGSWVKKLMGQPRYTPQGE